MRRFGSPILLSLVLTASFATVSRAQDTASAGRAANKPPQAATTSRRPSDPATPAAAPAPVPQQVTNTPIATPSSPLALHIGDADVTIGGFMDATTVIRSTNPGTGLGSSFGTLPFSNTPAGSLSEDAPVGAELARHTRRHEQGGRLERQGLSRSRLPRPGPDEPVRHEQRRDAPHAPLLGPGHRPASSSSSPASRGASSRRAATASRRTRATSSTRRTWTRTTRWVSRGAARWATGSSRIRRRRWRRIRAREPRAVQSARR